MTGFPDKLATKKVAGWLPRHVQMGKAVDDRLYTTLELVEGSKDIHSAII